MNKFDKTRKNSRNKKHLRHRRGRPERHTLAELVNLEGGHNATTRLTGVLATLNRIDRLPAIHDW